MTNRTICYCFNHTIEDLEKDVAEHGRSTIMEQIITDSKAGNCNCQTKNPKGRWCLSDVRQVVNASLEKIGKTPPQTVTSPKLVVTSIKNFLDWWACHPRRFLSGNQ